MLNLISREVIEQLTSKLSNGQSGTASKVQQRQEAIEIAFPKGFGSFRTVAEQERTRPPEVRFWDRNSFNESDIGTTAYSSTSPIS
jgi:hypothetical protein